MYSCTIYSFPGKFGMFFIRELCLELFLSQDKPPGKFDVF